MHQSAGLQDFHCLGDQCEDTCCRGWGMQVGEPTLAHYRAHAPELLEAVDCSGEIAVMKRDANTDHCVKFDGGWCGIHRDKGSDFLGDACHFFPRITRQLGDSILQTASLSCPEIARRALGDETSVFWQEAEVPTRLPFFLHHYLPPELSEDDALAIHHAFLNATQAIDADAPQILARLHSTAQSLMMIDKASWPTAVPFYLKTADARLSPAQMADKNPFQIYAALAGLVNAAPKARRPRLEAILASIEQALEVQFNTETGGVGLSENSLDRAAQMQQAWQFARQSWQPFLKRWLAAQLQIALFPFAGFGETLADRLTIIGVRMATLQLALQCQLAATQTLTPEDGIRIAQSLARFLDHLADPSLSIRIYAETGWNKTPQLWGLFG